MRDGTELRPVALSVVVEFVNRDCQELHVEGNTEHLCRHLVRDGPGPGGVLHYSRSGAIVTRKILRHSLGIDTCAGLYGYSCLALITCNRFTHKEAIEVGAIPHGEE